MPNLSSDSAAFTSADTWAHVRGDVRSVDMGARRIMLQREGGESLPLALTETSFVSLPDGTRAKIADVEMGVTLDATGVPQKDGSLLVEELFLAR